MNFWSETVAQKFDLKHVPRVPWSYHHVLLWNLPTCKSIYAYFICIFFLLHCKERRLLKPNCICKAETLCIIGSCFFQVFFYGIVRTSLIMQNIQLKNHVQGTLSCLFTLYTFILIKAWRKFAYLLVKIPKLNLNVWKWSKSFSMVFEVRRWRGIRKLRLPLQSHVSWLHALTITEIWSFHHFPVYIYPVISGLVAEILCHFYLYLADFWGVLWGPKSPLSVGEDFPH